MGKASLSQLLANSRAVTLTGRGATPGNAVCRKYRSTPSTQDTEYCRWDARSVAAGQREAMEMVAWDWFPLQLSIALAVSRPWPHALMARHRSWRGRRAGVNVG